MRWVNWPLSARLATPMVRVPEIEPVLTAWALVDRSPSMAFGTLGQTKDELAREVLAGLGIVMRRRGDRLGRGGDPHGRPRHGAPAARRPARAWSRRSRR